MFKTFDVMVENKLAARLQCHTAKEAEDIIMSYLEDPAGEASSPSILQVIHKEGW